MADFKDFYRDALVSRAGALRAAVSDCEDSPAEAVASIRRIAHALKGSGGSYGFPEISEAAAAVEDAAPDEIIGLTERLLGLMDELAGTQRRIQRVLLIDDDVTMVLLLEAVLESVGATMHAAGTGAEAQLALQHETYSLIILDLQLPDTDGRALLLRIKDNPRTARIPVAILSASGTSAVKSECYALGADAFFEKPIDPGEFAQGVAAILRRANAPAEDARPKASVRVVLVEDDDLVASLVKHRLSRAGFEVIHFTDGIAGAEQAGAHEPGLIILDVKVPGIDGFEVLRRLRLDEQTRNTPIVMLTSLGNERDIVRAFDLGASDYVTKPFSPAELFARVQRLLGMPA